MKNSLRLSALFFPFLVFFFYNPDFADAGGKKKKAVKASVTSVFPSCAEAGKIIFIEGKELNLIKTIKAGKSKLEIVSKSKKKIKVKLPKKISEGFVALNIQGDNKSKISSLFRVGCSNTLNFKEVIGLKATAAVSEEGGTISGKTVDGGAFSLNIPAGALSGLTPVSVIPIESLAGLPFSKGILSAVKFEPDGLTFDKPVTFTITFSKPPPAALVGFYFTGPNNEWSVVPIKIAGNTIEFSISHFSGAGAASPSQADFAAAVAPILSGIGALTVNQSENLLNILASFVSLFPDFCNDPSSAKLCTDIFTKVETSLTTELGTICPQDLEGPLPFISETAVAEVEKIEKFAQTAGFTGTIAEHARLCRQELLKRLIKRAGDDAKTIPTKERLEKIIELGVKADLAGFAEVGTLAGDIFSDALLDVIKLAGNICQSTPLDASDLGGIVEDVYKKATKNQELVEEKLRELYAACDIAVRISPSFVSVKPDSSQQFTASLPNIRLQGVIWNVSGTGNQVTQDGLLLTADKGGAFKVTAQSAGIQSIEGEATFVVEDVLSVSITPKNFEVAPGGTLQFFPNVFTVGPISTASVLTATGGSINSNGLYTAGNTEGTFQVRATSSARPEKFDVAPVIIKKPALPPLVATSNCTFGGVNFPTSAIGIIAPKDGKPPYTVTSVTINPEGPVLFQSPNKSVDARVSFNLPAGTYTFSVSYLDSLGAAASKTISLNMPASKNPADFTATGCDRFTPFVPEVGSNG